MSENGFMLWLILKAMQDEEEEEKEGDGEARRQEISQQFNKLLLEPIWRWEPIRKEEPIRNQEQIRMFSSPSYCFCPIGGVTSYSSWMSHLKIQ